MNTYELIFLGMLVLVSIVGLALLITASVRYKADVIWWVVSIVFAFLPGYVAYYAAKKKHLAATGAPVGEIKTAGRKSKISLAFIIAAWVAMVIVSSVALLRYKQGVTASLANPSASLVWCLAAIAVAYIVTLQLSGRRNKIS